MSLPHNANAKPSWIWSDSVLPSRKRSDVRRSKLVAKKQNANVKFNASENKPPLRPMRKRVLHGKPLKRED
jgi:hypothetical protein